VQRLSPFPLGEGRGEGGASEYPVLSTEYPVLRTSRAGVSPVMDRRQARTRETPVLLCFAVLGSEAVKGRYFGAQIRN
jgi:hypothetical protein